MTIAMPAESGHWYARDGSPCYEVENKSRPGEMRPTTLRDAKKLNLVPSVTTILRVAAQPGLERWKQQSLLHAALTLPRIEGETEDDFAKRALEDAAEQSRKAREKGTAIHGAIEKYLNIEAGGPDEMFDYIAGAQRACYEANIDISQLSHEKSFACCLGYGGKIDIHNSACVADFKTKADWDDIRKLAYDEHGMQLAAYAMGLGQLGCRLINIFISTDTPGKYYVHEWPREEHVRLLDQFRCLLTYWQLSNRFDHRTTTPFLY